MGFQRSSKISIVFGKTETLDLCFFKGKEATWGHLGQVNPPTAGLACPRAVVFDSQEINTGGSGRITWEETASNASDVLAEDDVRDCEYDWISGFLQLPTLLEKYYCDW